MNLFVGQKLDWKEGETTVNAYITAIKDTFIVVKIHGRSGRWQIPKSNLTSEAKQDHDLVEKIMDAKKS